MIIVISYGLFFYLQNNTESNIRNSLFEQQKQRQIGSTLALSQHIGSDLDSIMARLQDLANSVYLQQGDLLSSNTTKKLMEQMYVQMNNITTVDRLLILDENNIVRSNIVPKGEEAFVGINFSYTDWVRDTKNTLMPIFSNGFEGRDGKYRIAITHPIINNETGKYIGLVAALIPTTEFFAHYGNIYNIKANFLVAFDKKGNYIATPRTQLLGKNYFGNQSQKIFHYNQLQYNLYRKLLEGQPGYAVYDFGIGERLNTGYPVFVQGKPTYFVSAVTPTFVIYSQINGVILTQRIETFSLLAGTTAAIVVLIIFLIRWSSNLNDEVKRRTKELNESNKELNTLAAELKRANDSLTESNKQLAVANEQLKVHDKMQKEFINIASHELKTPTQAILGYSALIQGHPERRDEMILAIERNAVRLQSLTNSILDVSRIESQTLKLNKEKFNINEKIRNVIEDIKSRMDKIEIAFADPKVDPIVVEADKTRIYEVISNLLLNAIKFTQKKSSSSDDGNSPGECTITVFTDIKSNQRYGKGSSNGGVEEVIISIRDRGAGIDPDIQNRLFSKFVTKSDTGTGLGLYISKGIVEAHGGRIWAENNADGKRGATFYFSLPLSK
ncbi:MAG TPA: sensor histidine kinase [Nitrososphaeraceae archaeon]|nr:sensor histidine kinase [Nitrososphaeraceae archaeon]